MPDVTMVEIHAADPARAAKFYEAAFGWRFNQPMPGYFARVAESPVHVAIFRRRGLEPAEGQPVNSYVATIAVDALDAALAAIEAAGGRVAVQEYRVPNAGWSAYFKDTEGNIVGLFQADASAA